jgi:hypothetical protein
MAQTGNEMILWRRMSAWALRPTAAPIRRMAFVAPTPNRSDAPPTEGWQALGREWRIRWSQVGAWLMVAIAVAVLGFSTLAVLRNRLFDCSATIKQIERPGLRVGIAHSTTYQPGTAGQLLHEGSILVAESGAVAHIGLCGDGLLRTESAGRWRLVELRRSRNGQISRVVIEQIEGRASVVSPPAHVGRQEQTIVLLPEGQVEVRGVVTLYTTASGETQVNVLQGRCVVVHGAMRRELGAGEALVLP